MRSNLAYAMEGLSVKSFGGAVATMRAADHQLQQTQIISTWVKVNGKDIKYDQEDTGFGWKTDILMGTEVITKPTSCKMRRPNTARL